ncbi:MAG: Uma2 family endonuclease [Planctomycetota bacterium]|nr:MAG: Uma2 family endonuclease [Planctomycetota bacterium]
MVRMATDLTIAGDATPDWTGPVVHFFSVDDFHRLAAAGVFGPEDRVELIAGQIYDMTPIGAPHATSVQLALAALWKLPLATAIGTWHIRVQQPLTLAHSEPQPDLAIVRGKPGDYAMRHPAAGDVGLVIEVADASLLMDRGKKLAMYAGERIPQYWIVDLASRRVECYSTPSGPRAEGTPSFSEQRIANETDEVAVVLEETSYGPVRVTDLIV